MTLLVVAAGCSVPADGAETGGTSTTASAPTSSADDSSTTAVITSIGDASTVAASTAEPSTGDPADALECDVWQQDCRDGEKCAPIVGEGSSSWDTTKCVPVVAEPRQPGEPCTMPGGQGSGTDDCAAGVYCHETDAAGENGTCRALCAGSADAPECAVASSCVMHGEFFNVCMPWCHPLAEDCPDDTKCIAYEGAWFCVLGGVENEGPHDACEFANACEAGLACVEPAAALECAPQASGCCQAFCDVTAPNECTGVGQTCAPWYAPGLAPDGYETLGVCRV